MGPRTKWSLATLVAGACYSPAVLVQASKTTEGRTLGDRVGTGREGRGGSLAGPGMMNMLD